MQYELDRVKTSPPTEPSLAEMTEKALKVLQRDNDGYFLFVESKLWIILFIVMKQDTELFYT